MDDVRQASNVDRMACDVGRSKHEQSLMIICSPFCDLPWQGENIE